MRLGSVLLLVAVFVSGLAVGLSQTRGPDVPVPSVVELREASVENATASPPVASVAPTVSPAPRAPTSPPRPVERVDRRVEEDEIDDYEHGDGDDGKNRHRERGRSGESDD